MIPLPLLLIATVAAAMVGAGRRLERLVVANRSTWWRAIVVAVGVDAVPAAIAGNWLALIAVLLAVDAGWRLAEQRLPDSRARTIQPASVLPDNVIPLTRPRTTT